GVRGHGRRIRLEAGVEGGLEDHEPEEDVRLADRDAGRVQDRLQDQDRGAQDVPDDEEELIANPRLCGSVLPGVAATVADTREAQVRSEACSLSSRSPAPSPWPCSWPWWG